MDNMVEAQPALAAPVRRGGMPLWVKFAFGAFALAMAFYGFLVADQGYLIGVTGSNAAENARIVEMVEQGGRDVSQLDESRMRESAGTWMWLESKISSDTYEFGKDSIFETIGVYLKSDDFARISLSMHMALGLIIMTLGPLQFWTPARKRWPKLHRYGGYFYVGTVLVSMSFAAIYLYRTDPYHGILGPFFYKGLIMADIFTTTTIILAVVFAVRRDLSRHGAFMAFNFMWLLTAPMLRVVWVIISSLFHDRMTFQMTNTYAQQMVLMLCGLVAYLIFTMVRAYQKPRGAIAANPAWTKRVGQGASLLLLPVALMWAYYMARSFDHFLDLGWGLNDGLVYPEGLRAVEQNIAHTLPVLAWATQIGLATAICIGFGIMLELFNKPLLERVTRISFVRVGAFAFLPVSLVVLAYGVAVGLPTETVTGGGGVFTTIGLFGTIFSAGLLGLHIKGQALLAKEVALIVSTIFTAFPLVMQGWAGVHPGDFPLERYEYAAGSTKVSTYFAFFFIYIAYSEYTRSRNPAT